jgi:uncharacterized DUF497 family protein
VTSSQTILADGLTFVWNRAKAEANKRKHGVTFEEAATVFSDVHARVRKDPTFVVGEVQCNLWATVYLGDFSWSSMSRCTMKQRSASSQPARSTRKSAGSLNESSPWTPNPYAKHVSKSGRRTLAMRALAAELGPGFVILSPDLIESFPSSEAVNEALRAVLAAAKAVHTPKPRKRLRAA